MTSYCLGFAAQKMIPARLLDPAWISSLPYSLPFRYHTLNCGNDSQYDSYSSGMMHSGSAAKTIMQVTAISGDGDEIKRVSVDSDSDLS